MEKVCPVCNKLNDVNIKCEICENSMVNLGRVQDFADPYGTADPINDAENYCIHLFKCENCNNKAKIKVTKIKI